MQRLIHLNGQIIPASEAGIDLSNRAFRYGDGLFETIRLTKGKALFFPLHYSRFVLGMDTLQYEIPEEWAIRTLQDWIENLAEEAGIENGRVRMTAWRTGAGLYTPEALSPELLIEISPMDGPWYTWPKAGIKVDLSEEVQVGTAAWERVKKNSAIPYVLAAIERKKRGVDDLLLRNQAGRLVEATSSNIHVWLDGKLITPPEEEGGIPGVMSRVLIKIARREGIRTERRPLELGDLEQAKELFLTNVISGMRWVESYRDKKFANDFAFGLFGKLEEKVLREISK